MVLFLSLLLVLSSCGTMRSKKNIIFADSEPRGLEVRNEKNKVLGLTPLFFKVKPRGKRTFSFFKEEVKL